MPIKQTQLTHASYGHTLNSTQAFSKDGGWIVYDTRNDDTKIGSTGSIEMVNIHTGEVRELYHTSHQTEFGPGVGAATFSPVEDSVLFIHGVRDADQAKPYGTTRRTGVAIDTDKPQQPIFMDARDVRQPFTPGALRGGTHAHSWSGDGQWISFTYNDYLVEPDLRMVGVMVPGKVAVQDDGSLENNSGERFSVVVTEVTKNPKPGSDEIDKAFDECWIGSNGYDKPDGSRQRRAIAFQGNVMDQDGSSLTEVFVADLPDDVSHARPGHPLEGTLCGRPAVPAGVRQRRVTFSKKGIEGPRHWLRASPDGSLILFLSGDPAGIIQIYGVSPNGGAVRQLTHGPFGVQGPFNVNPDGQWVVYAADNSIFITRLADGDTKRLSAPASDGDRPVGAPNWSPDGKRIAYNRYVAAKGSRYLQIFLIQL